MTNRLSNKLTYLADLFISSKRVKSFVSTEWPRINALFAEETPFLSRTLLFSVIRKL